MSDKYLKSLTFPDLADRYVVGDSSLSVSGAAADAKTTGDALATKAEIDGAYESMTVGNAEQLVSSISKEDNAPYNFRTSGGSLDIGDREYLDKIVGGTVAWNQLVGTYNYTSGSSAKTTVLDADVEIIAGHKYLIAAKASNVPTSAPVLYIFINQSGSAQVVGSLTINAINKCGIVSPQGGGKGGGANAQGYAWLYQSAGDCDVTNVQIIDLTQMFGTAIADYLYTLETGSAGTGVAWFKKLFPKPYYAYNAGELVSVKTSSHDTVGFNQWDEEWENGYYNVTTGAKVTNSNYIRSKNFIPVLPSTAYYFKTPAVGIILYYDADMNYIEYKNYFRNDVFTPPSNCHYITFFLDSGYGTTYNHDICINLSWDGERDGEYEAYKKNTYPLDSDLELRGIPKLDASNNLYYDGDTYESDGTVTRKYGMVDLGTLEWTKDSDYTYMRFGAAIDGKAKPADYTVRADNLLCPLYTADATGAISGTVDKVMSGYQGYSAIYITNSDYSDAAAFKTAMNGVYLVYELATPTTEEADAYQNPQIVDDFGTEEFVDTRDVAVPVGHSTRYQPNLRAKLEMMPNSPDGDGDYIVRQTSGENEYVALASNATIQALMAKLPSAPSEDGAYKLTCTVTNGTAVYSWEAE